MSFNEAGVNLHWHPKWEQTYFGHSNPSKYNSAYSIGFVVILTQVSNLWATNDARWRSVAERLSLQSWYQSGFLLYHFTVCLPSPPSLLVAMDPALIDGDRDAVTSFYEAHPLSFDGAPQRDPDIYRDMYYTRYHSYTLEWHAYPLETMAHYCLRFQEAMLPYVPQDIDHPVMEALTILRNGLPGRIRQYVPFPMPRMTVGHMIKDILGAEVHADAEQAEAAEGDHQAPVDDAGIGKPLHEVGPAPPEEPIPAVPEQEVPAHEAEEQEDAEGDPDAEGPEEDDIMVIPADPPADPPIVDISSDEEDDVEVIPADPPADPLVIDISSDEEGDDEDMELAPELEQAGWLEYQEDFGDDPEEILFDDGDWEADSDAPS
ncbi:hypothetical protein TIFTF001_037066 [Ficus carica]|uniref:Uncharacterized protein n=1 Tax=Ficus carica TaxID=3494 RepID=A0AA88E968_FICCA|nr:hypothetical protein TIFTF001_037066 [Ficus carica]